MSSVFTRIINGDLPGRFVFRDDVCVAFLTIEPLTPGHTLVVPVLEVDHWLDLDDTTADHLFLIARRVGRAIEKVFSPTRIALIIAGLEVPHTHLHVLGIETEGDLDFSQADRAPDPAKLDAAAREIADALQR